MIKVYSTRSLSDQAVGSLVQKATGHYEYSSSTKDGPGIYLYDKLFERDRQPLIKVDEDYLQ